MTVMREVTQEINQVFFKFVTLYFLRYPWFGIFILFIFASESDIVARFDVFVFKYAFWEVTICLPQIFPSTSFTWYLIPLFYFTSNTDQIQLIIFQSDTLFYSTWNTVQIQLIIFQSDTLFYSTSNTVQIQFKYS